MNTIDMSKTASRPKYIRAPKVKTASFLFSLLFLPLSVLSQLSFAEPLLNGLAISTELGKERFIAALYTDNLSDNSGEVLNSTARRSMELKIVADRLSSRSLNNMWIEGIAINNSSSALERQANNTLKLTNFVRKRLFAGDILRFDYEVGKGVDVVLNEVTLGNIPSDDFFNMLLRTWIGSVPLSSEFRNNLLSSGDIDSALVNRYNALQPQEGRAAAVASWIEQAPTNQNTVATRPQPPRPRIEIAAPKPEVSLGELAAPTIATVSEDEDKKAVMADQLPNLELATEEPAQQEIAVAAPATDLEPSAPQDTLALATEPVAAAIDLDEEEEEEEESYNIESILARQYYLSELNKLSQRALRYPRIAEQRGQEGSVRANVTINRDGSIKDVNLIEESRYRPLNREVLKTIDRVAPYPPVPKEIPGEEFQFPLLFGFHLEG